MALKRSITQNIVHAPGIILKIVPFAESDILATAICRDLGRFTLLVRGARRSKRRFMGGLDIFDCGILDLLQPSRTNKLPVLQALGSREHWPVIRQNLTAFGLACYCAELTLAFTAEGEPSAGDLFAPLYFTLSTLNKQHSVEHAHALAAFYNLVLLQRSGLNFLDDSSNTCAPETTEWFAQMLNTNSVIVHRKPQIIEDGFFALTRHSQTLLGHPLRSVSEHGTLGIFRP